MDCNNIIKDFLKYLFVELSFIKGVKLESYPKLVLTTDKSKTETLAHFNISKQEIVVYVKDRLLADIFRSIAHECVHYIQLINNELDNTSGETGSVIENEANSLAGIILRNYTKLHPEILVTQYQFNNTTPTLQGDVPIPDLSEINSKLEEDIRRMYQEILPIETSITKEVPVKVHDYGCLMLQLNVPYWNSILGIIKEEDLYTQAGDSSYGLEDEPHVTVLYGFIEGTNTTKMRRILEKLSNPIEVKLTEINLFENDKFDVVKFNVDSPSLHKLHEYFKNNFPNEEKFKDYSPHATIAYVNKGEGKKYVKKLKEPIILNSNIFKYSSQDGSELFIEPYNVDYDLMKEICCQDEYTAPDDNFDQIIKHLTRIKSTDESLLNEAEYQGSRVTLNKPMRGDIKKFKVYVKNKSGKVVKVNFGSNDYNIKKNNPDRKNHTVQDLKE